MSRDKQGNRLTPLTALRLAAPHTWPGPSVLTTVFGGVYAIANGYVFDPLIWCLLLATAIFAQSAVNVFNDHADFLAGTDTAENSDDPTDAVLVYGDVDLNQVFILGIVFLFAAIICGLIVTWWSMSILPLFIGLIGAIFIFLYSHGKVPVSYLPLGELVSGVVMGCLIPLAGIVVFAGRTLGSPDPIALIGNFNWVGTILMTLPFILGVGLIMATQNICDIERDRSVGRRTLPVLLGHRQAVFVYRVAVVFWVAVVLHLAFWGFSSGFWAALVTLVLGAGALKGALTSPLEPDVRAPSMMLINKANLFINGALILAVMVSLI